MRIAIVFGTRPELIKLAPLIQEGKRLGIELHAINTGQHREMLVPLLEWFEIKPDFDLAVMQSNQSLAELSSKVLLAFASVLSKEHYDCVVVQGDTTTAFMVSLVSFYHKIKIVHVEAGLRTHNKYSPWPEEINRKLLSVVADFHFAPTEESARNLKNENVRDNVWVTGNTVIDALHFTVRKVSNQHIFPEPLKDYFNGEKKHAPIILITGHRRENWGEGFKSICAAISSLASQNPSFVFVYPVHLNPNVKNDVHNFLKDIDNVLLLPPLNYPEFVALMNRSYLILTDSGGVQEEAPSLGKPVLVMRDTTERPEGVAIGCVKLVGTDAETIIRETQLLINDKDAYDRMAKVKNPFGNGDASGLILSILKSSIDNQRFE